MGGEEIDAQRFREVLRSYDKSQAGAVLAELASRYCAEARSQGANDVTRLDLEGPGQGVDRDAVTRVLEAAVADLRASAGVGRGGPGADSSGETGEPVVLVDRPDDATLVGSAREIASAIRGAARREAEEIRQLAAKAAANVVEQALREIDEVSTARAAADDARAAAVRAESERELSDLRAEAAKVAQAAVDELTTARSLASEAQTDRAAAAELRIEAQHNLVEALALVREQEAQSEQLMDRTQEAAAKLVEDATRDAAELRSRTERELADAWEELEEVSTAVADARQEAAEIRRRAVQDTVIIKADLESTAEVLLDLTARLEARRADDDQLVADAIRRFEDQILSAAGELQEQTQEPRLHVTRLLDEGAARVREAAQKVDVSRADPREGDPA